MTDFIFNLHKISYIKYISIFLSYTYLYLLPFILGFWIFYSGVRKMYAFSIIVLSSLSTWIISEILKNIIRAQRPLTEGLIISEPGFSFPSQHSSVTMVIGIVVYSMDKKLGSILIIVSLFVALSRVILGVHYLVDVIAGISVGILMGLLFVKLFKNI